MGVKYKNRKTLFGKLHRMRNDLRNMVSNNQELLVGSEVVMLKAVESKIHTLTKGQERRKKNK